MTDDEVEMFLDDLSEEDWVFMVGPDGKLKSLLIPDFKNEDIIHDRIFKVLALLDPKIVKELNILIEEEKETEFEDLEIKPDDTVH
jgi:hypothetical protein